jgi:hypothetical protein
MLIKSIFNRFLNRKSNTIADTVSDYSPIPEQLFVNNEPPVAAAPQQAVAVAQPQKQRPLDRFLEQRYDLLGLNDGYDFHDLDVMEKRLHMFGAEFRQVIDRAIAENQEYVHGLKMHLIESEGLSPRLDAKLNQEISYFEQALQDLREQKLLSVDGEGLLAHSLQQYRFGFAKGIEQYRQEKLLLGGVHTSFYAK